ncbi:FxLYD domain-containing protein [Kineococcus arenarius]|uniref:FxLYD domain-containing protein n=1 Tax=Kineococcus sp. SYSU DK007 TaxID=3383128 RepID=UPI003D7D4F71
MTTTARPAPSSARRPHDAVAVASVVLGAAGAVTALVPRLHVLALCLALLGAGAGAVSLRRARRVAVAGLVLSLAAAAVVVAVTARERGDVVDGTPGPGPAGPGVSAPPAEGGAAGTRPSGAPEGIAVTGCGDVTGSGTATATLEVTGTAERPGASTVVVEWMDAADAQLGRGSVVVEELAPGETRTVQVRGEGVTGAVACRVLEVTGA